MARSRGKKIACSLLFLLLCGGVLEGSEAFSVGSAWRVAAGGPGAGRRTHRSATLFSVVGHGGAAEAQLQWPAPSTAAAPSAAPEAGKSSGDGRLPHELPRRLGEGKVLRLLVPDDVEPIIALAFEEFMPPLEQGAGEEDPIGAQMDALERALLRYTMMWGFLARVKVAAEGKDHKVFCISPAARSGGSEDFGDPLGLAEVSLQATNGQTAPPLPVPRIWKQILGFPHALRPYISNVLVDPMVRRQGVAQNLMRACEEQARAWGHGEVYLHVELTNEAALGLYCGMGYERVRDDPWWFTVFNWPRLRYMRKSLAKEAAA
ncbi:unnamed protein product [Phaeothamnion confervicola]